MGAGTPNEPPMNASRVNVPHIVANWRKTSTPNV
jgi:hypothetical protein